MLQRQEKIKQQVERFGIFYEKFGFPPLAGRLVGYLLLAEPPHKSFYEIQDFLMASKSSVSNAIKFLIGQKIVDYITFPGDRKRYFKINAHTWLKETKDRVADIAEIKTAWDETLAMRSDKYPEFNDGIKMLSSFHEYIEIELSKAIQQWENKHKINF